MVAVSSCGSGAAEPAAALRYLASDSPGRISISCGSESWPDSADEASRTSPEEGPCGCAYLLSGNPDRASGAGENACRGDPETSAHLQSGLALRQPRPDPPPDRQRTDPRSQFRCLRLLQPPLSPLGPALQPACRSACAPGCAAVSAPSARHGALLAARCPRSLQRNPRHTGMHLAPGRDPQTQTAFRAARA